MMKRMVNNLLHKELSYLIHGAAIEVRKNFGSGHKEKLYQTAFAKELTSRNIRFEQEKAIKIFSPKDGNYVGLYRPDFIVNDQIIVETKAEKFVSRDEIKRVYDYLRNSKYELAYLINFASSRLFVRRIIYTNDRKPSLAKASLVSISLVFISLLLVSISVAPSVQASEMGLGTSKERFDLNLLSGDTYQGDLAVFNRSLDAALPVHIGLQLWNLKEDSEDIEFVTAEPLLNATKWFKVEPSDFIIGPDQSRLVNFEIATPRDAAPGTYLVMMLLQPAIPEHYFSEKGPRFIPEVGVLFFINVSSLALEGEKESFDARIVSFAPADTHRLGFFDRWVAKPVSAGVFDEAVKKLVAKVQNNGLYFFKASGFVAIKNMFGQTVALIKFPEKYLLPNRTRSIPITIVSPPPDQPNILYSIFYILRQQTYLGPYTAALTLEMPNGAPITAEIGFWVIPWKFWLLLITLSALCLFVIIKVRRRIKPALRALIQR